MGQSSSRHGSSTRPTPSTSSSRTRESTLCEDEASSSREQANSPRETPTTTKRSRRSSLRRSILGLLPNGSSSSPSSSMRARKESTPSASEGHQPLRKRWRSSRRWSKTPAQLAELSGTAQEPPVVSSDRDTGAGGSSSLGVPDVIPLGAPSLSSRTSTPSPATRSSSPPPETPAAVSQEGFSNEHCQLDPHYSSWAGDVPPSPAPEPISAEAVSAPSGHPSTEDIEREVNEFLHGHPDIPDDFPDLESASHNTITAEQSPSAAEAPAQQASSPRHFPPPGTLVVVQGVVNTTDSPQTSQTTPAMQNNTSPSLRSPAGNIQTQPAMISRRRSLSTPRSNGSDDRHRRHRLSSLIRPASMLGRGPSDNGSHAPPTSLSVPDFNRSESRFLDEEAAAPNISSTASVSDTQIAPPSEGSNGQRGLSQGSIDVLGTLLSVAAAATAASLFSPGLSFNNPGNGGVTPLNPSARPLSPTPTAGLGALGGLGGLSGLGLNPAVPHSSPGTAQDSRDRIRNMWESIRERVGLNHRNSGTAAGAGVTGGQAVNDDSGGTHRMRPGELMLAEMARALNAGLGLANSGERRTAEQPAADAAGNNMVFAPVWDPNQPPPPDGSFERFLFNLQTDLRTILANDGASAITPATQSADTTSTSHSPPDPAQIYEAVVPPEVVSQDAEMPLGEEEDEVHRASEELGSEGEEGGQDRMEGHDDDDTDTEVVSAEEAREPAPRRTPPRTPTPIPPTSGPSFTQERATAGNTRGHAEATRPAINIWRLYRFDPIPATQTHEQAAAASTSGTNTSPIFPATSLEPDAQTLSRPSSTLLSTAPESTSEQSERGSASTDAPANFVIPVIVVGLQSVDTSGQDENEDDAVMGEMPSTNDLHDDPTTARPRGRTWHSRAANALRTLRPGRRGASRTGQSSEGSGSRTFLIYVIGGYYPPNHHMVTGSDTLDSYEALWELAELLGQVKPPTATKEDIDKSGLQIIKASDLQRYEQEGRIASNCVDRCLICLDDYDPEGDLRVMSCRHTFHKDCVDKWLQVGRNNCPACRSQGVSVAGEATTSAPQSSQMTTSS